MVEGIKKAPRLQCHTFLTAVLLRFHLTTDQTSKSRTDRTKRKHPVFEHIWERNSSDLVQDTRRHDGETQQPEAATRAT